MRYTFVIAVLGAALCATSAEAQSAEPDPGTRVILQKDDGEARLLLDAPEAEEEDPDEGVSIGVRTRYVTIPDALFESIFIDHTSYDSYSIGLEVGIDGPGSLRVIFGLDYTDLSLPAGNFRLGQSAFSQTAESPAEASFTEIDLHMIALDVTFLWNVEFIESFGLMYGVGLGVAFTPGTIYATDVLPTCKPPVDECASWRSVTREEQELPSPVWPLLSAQVGLYWDPSPGWRIRIEGGFRGVLFTGLAARAAF